MSSEADTNIVSELYGIVFGKEQELRPVYDRLRQLGIDEPTQVDKTNREPHRQTSPGPKPSDKAEVDRKGGTSGHGPWSGRQFQVVRGRTRQHPQHDHPVVSYFRRLGVGVQADPTPVQ